MTSFLKEKEKDNIKLVSQYDEIFLYQCKTKENRRRNEEEIDDLHPTERTRYMKKMMLEFLKEELRYKEKEIKEHYFCDFLDCLIEDLKRKADQKGTQDCEMHYIGEGFSVICFRIGENVFTVGRYKDHNIDLPCDERFLNLKLNRTFPIYNERGEALTIQLMTEVSTKNISDKDVYFLYKHYREKGYIWLDCKKSNIGRLLYPNHNPYPDIEERGRTYLGIQKPSAIPLEKGELIVFDIDGFIPEDKLKDIDWPVKDSPIRKRLEKKYQKEQKKKTK